MKKRYDGRPNSSATSIMGVQNMSITNAASRAESELRRWATASVTSGAWARTKSEKKLAGDDAFKLTSTPGRLTKDMGSPETESASDWTWLLYLESR